MRLGVYATVVISVSRLCHVSRQASEAAAGSRTSLQCAKRRTSRKRSERPWRRIAQRFNVNARHTHAARSMQCVCSFRSLSKGPIHVR